MNLNGTMLILQFQIIKNYNHCIFALLGSGWNNKKVEITTEVPATLEFIELQGSIVLSRIRLTEIDRFESEILLS